MEYGQSDIPEYVFMKNAVEKFQESNLPTISHAAVCTVNKQNEFIIETKWKQNNYELNKRDVYCMLYKYDATKQQLEKIPTVIPTESVLLEARSPSLKQKAVIKKHVDETTKKVEYVFELWSNALRLKVINLTSLEKHGKVHSDVVFGSLLWSHDGDKIVYIAEKKREKSLGFFEKTFDENKERGFKYLYEEGWGEQLTDVTNTVMCVLTISDKTVEIVEAIPDDICPLNPTFGPNNGLVFVGLHTSPFRMGAMYCENRQSRVYHLDLNDKETKAKEITLKSEEPISNCHPQFNKNITKCAFLQRQLKKNGDTHMGSYQLMIYDILKHQLHTVCNQLTDEDKSFPLFVKGSSIHYNYWLGDNVHVVLPVICNGRNNLCIVNTETGKLLFKTECSSLLCVFENIILGSFMKLGSRENALMIINCNDLTNIKVKIESVTVAENELIDMESKGMIDQHGITSFYVIQKGGATGMTQKYPMLVYIHGGPHSLFTDDFNRNARFFFHLGYVVLLVNYRGSIGFTNESLQSLPGNIGTQDVKDVQDTVNAFLDLKKDLIDKNNIFIGGGSHGGFLTLHLIGQYPDFYQAAFVRNPSVEICSKSIASDIPDWNYVECGLDYLPSDVPSHVAFASMLSKSPITHLTSIKSPLLLCVGEKDARISCTQSKHLFRLMKANKKTVEMILYPDDCHSLSRVETDADCLLNIARWFYRHRNDH